MRPLLLTLLTIYLGQSAYCSIPRISSIGLSKQKRMVGLQAKRYESGFRTPLTVDYFLSDSVPATEMYNKGRQDAKAFYKNSAAFWITFGTTVASSFFIDSLFVLPGLATGLAIGLTKPKHENLMKYDKRYRTMWMADSTDQLFQDSLYVEGYEKGAKKSKFRSAARGFGAGLIPVSVFMLAIFTAWMLGIRQ